jgi:hypothetical protein
VVSGILMGLATYLRWWPCFSDYTNSDCTMRQDHDLDHISLYINQAWQHIEGFTVLVGSAAFVTALGWLLVVVSLREYPAVRIVAAVLVIRPLHFCIIVCETILARKVPPGPGLFEGWWFFYEPASFTLILYMVLASRMPPNTRVRVLLALVAFSSIGVMAHLVEFFTTNFLFGWITGFWSHDTNPGFGLGSAMVRIGCGLAILRLTPSKKAELQAGVVLNPEQ